ncbi:MAG: hypothetical protein WKG00_20050 [Polyangiaceae bacterium]
MVASRPSQTKPRGWTRYQALQPSPPPTRASSLVPSRATEPPLVMYPSQAVLAPGAGAIHAKRDLA